MISLRERWHQRDFAEKSAVVLIVVTSFYVMAQVVRWAA